MDYFTGLEKKHHQLPLMEKEYFSKEAFELLITKTISPPHQIALKFTSRWSGLVSLTQISFPFYLYKQNLLTDNLISKEDLIEYKELTDQSLKELDLSKTQLQKKLEECTYENYTLEMGKKLKEFLSLSENVILLIAVP
ncbi:hypothetical protein [Neobacillus sp. CF12]|uniref:hypothetical protein n=1 Tax=Neobacillus sp. CF12 TaxID=3055864 RepID=UPI0025A27E32|nr:hypothetical protein [Neobacillus sp. CF12]MDM5328672.1 hypothetical protein [Neobacillus sp. CF12]